MNEKKLGAPRYRAKLGPKFSEGSRRLWFALRGRGFAWAATQVAASAGVVNRHAYGDVLPSETYRARYHSVFGIAESAWLCAPKRDFEPNANG